MTTPDALALALDKFRADNGQLAADALVIECATEADKAKLGAPLKALRTVSEARRVGVGDDMAAEIVTALLKVLKGDGNDA